MDLQTFFMENPSGALAFSGGTDSSLLVWAAAKYGRAWHAYYVHSAFQPAFELSDARRVAEQCGLPLTVLEASVLTPEIAANPADRCYHCKQRLFSLLRRQAASDGYTLLIDGTNASDSAEDRPGMRALRELEVRSPLRECGLSKADVRSRCREAGLFVWNKPAYACLATRIPTGTPITPEALAQVEQGEAILYALGFRDFRLRLHGSVALLQITADQFPLADARRGDLCARLSALGLQPALDLLPRQPST